jgi:hypothetical protein
MEDFGKCDNLHLENHQLQKAAKEQGNTQQLFLINFRLIHDIKWRGNTHFTVDIVCDPRWIKTYSRPALACKMHHKQAGSVSSIFINLIMTCWFITSTFFPSMNFTFFPGMYLISFIGRV